VAQEALLARRQKKMSLELMTGLPSPSARSRALEAAASAALASAIATQACVVDRGCV